MKLINKIKNWWKEFHICYYKLIDSEYRQQTMYKKLYEVNGWSRGYTIKKYRCKKCGRIHTESSSINGIS